MSEFFLGLASGLILLLVGQRILVAHELRGRREKQLGASELENEIRRSLDGFGLGLSTLGLSVILNNRTGTSLRVRRVELSSDDGSQVVRLQHNPDSQDIVLKELPPNGQRMSVAMKFPTDIGLTQEAGEVPAGSRADWVLPNSLYHLVGFSPAKVSFFVAFHDGTHSSRAIEHEASGSMCASIPSYVDAWRKKCQELSK